MIPLRAATMAGLMTILQSFLVNVLNCEVSDSTLSFVFLLPLRSRLWHNRLSNFVTSTLNSASSALASVSAAPGNASSRQNVGRETLWLASKRVYDANTDFSAWVSLATWCLSCVATVARYTSKKVAASLSEAAGSTACYHKAPAGAPPTTAANFTVADVTWAIVPSTARQKKPS